MFINVQAGRIAKVLKRCAFTYKMFNLGLNLDAAINCHLGVSHIG